MKLRITAGLRRQEINVSTNGLKQLYNSTMLSIEGDEKVISFKWGNGKELFIVGNPIGFRDRKNKIIPFEAYSEKIKKMLQGKSLEKSVDLEGRFILIVVHNDGSCEICADRYGQADIYYYNHEGKTYIVSDLSFLPPDIMTGGFDQLGLIHSLTIYGLRPPKQNTLYKDVHRLGVGQIIKIDKTQTVISEKPFKPINTTDFGEKDLRRYSDLLLDSVMIRGSRQGNVLYLSSGWDSTAILACLVYLFGKKKVRGVIGRMRYSERSGVINQFEIDRARKFADYYGIPLDIVEFDYRTKGPELVERARPLWKSHHITGGPSINFLNLAEFVAETNKGDEALFCGEISDGVHNLGFSQFMSIPHPVLAFREYSDKMASFLFGPTFCKMIQENTFKEDTIYNLFLNRSKNDLFDEAAKDPAGRIRQLLSSFFMRGNRLPLWSIKNHKMLTDGGMEYYTSQMEKIYLNSIVGEVSSNNIYSYYLHLYNSFHWQSSNVKSIFVTAESKGMHMNMPFWDCRIQDFLSSMPENWGRGLDMKPTKYPLKWMLENRLDYPMQFQNGYHSYLYDVDPSFSLPAEIIFHSSFTPLFKKVLSSYSYHSWLSSELFDIKYIDNMVNRYLKNKSDGSDLKDLSPLCWLASLFATGD